MSRIIPGFAGACAALLSLTLMLALFFVWTADAYAQTSFEGQYGNPTASGEAALTGSGSHSGSHSGSVDSSSSAPDSSVSATGVLPLTGLLPDTGGPLFPLFGLGVLALSFGGLLVLRRLNER